VVRFIIVPGAFAMVCLVGVVGFGLWDTFHPVFRSEASSELAYSGNIQAQRSLASCYEAGCRIAPPDPTFACAWRQIIVAETARKAVSDVAAAKKICRQLSTEAQKVVPILKADIRFEMREIHVNNEKIHNGPGQVHDL
jgi:hypothetical protein